MPWVKRILSSAHGSRRRHSIDAGDGHTIVRRASHSRLRVGVVHRQDLTDGLALSGTHSFMLKSLQKHAGDVVNVSGYPDLVAQVIELVGLVLNKFTYALFRLWISADHHRLLAWRLGSIFTRRASSADCDIIFAPTGSVELACLNLLSPTKAEAMDIVIGEASAHGLPAIVRNTGGVGGMLYEGKNGFLLPPDATGADYAKQVMEALSDMATYRKLCASSRDFYEQRLNWDSWGQSMREVFMYSFAHPMHLLRGREQQETISREA